MSCCYGSKKVGNKEGADNVYKTFIPIDYTFFT